MHRLLALPAPVRDLALLITRLVLGIVLLAHAWQKFSLWGMDGTAASFTKMGVPAPLLSAWFAGLVELVGGVAIILGALTPLFALLVVGDMLGAFWFVHKANGPFVADTGWELVGMIAAAAFALIGAGAGRWSVDHALARRAGGTTPEAAADRPLAGGATRA